MTTNNGIFIHHIKPGLPVFYSSSAREVLSSTKGAFGSPLSVAKVHGVFNSDVDEMGEFIVKSMNSHQKLKDAVAALITLTEQLIHENEVDNDGLDNSLFAERIEAVTTPFKELLNSI